MKMKKLIALLLASVMCFTMLEACGSSGSEPAAAQSQAASASSAAAETAEPGVCHREITVGSTDMYCVGHFDISSKLNNSFNAYASFLAYDPMILTDPYTGEAQSDILSEYYFDTDTNCVVLTIKPGVTFSNGDQMTAEDILYTLDRQSYVFYKSDEFEMMHIHDATISDDGLTVHIPFSEPYRPWKSYFDGCNAVMNKSWCEEHGGDDMDFEDPALVCGSGPYKVTEYVADSYVVYERRDDWWMKDNPREGNTIFDKITVKFYPDESTMMVDFANGDIDIAIGINEADYNRIAEDSSLGTVDLMDNRAVCVINMDVDNGPLTDINLRKAICYGTDIDALEQISFGSLGKTATSSLATSSPAYEAGYAYPYDPDLAKQTLEENNISDVKLTWIVNSGFPAAVAEAFQGMMADLGITIDVQVYDPATVMQMCMEEGATQLLLDGYNFGNIDNEPYMQYMMLFSNNMNPASRKYDQKLNDMLNEARNTMDEEKGNAIYKEVQKYLFDNYYQIPIVEWSTALCFNNTIATCKPGQTSMANLRCITVN